MLPFHALSLLQLAPVLSRHLASTLRVLGTCAALTCSLPAQSSHPAGEALISATPMTAWRLNGANGQSTLVDVTGPGISQAWRITTVADTSPSYAIEFRTPVTRAVARGDIALLRFLARAVTITDESGAAFLQVVAQKSSPNYDKSLQATQSLTHAWQEFFVPFTFDADYAARAVEVVFGFGFKRQSVELAGFDFVYYGKSVALSSLPRTRATYAGSEAGAPWRTAALARIETLRKGDFSIVVVDAQGRPVPGATARVTQTKSAFHFGTALQMSRLVNDSPDNRLYRQKTLELFNAASTENDLKWPPWDGEWGSSFAKTQTLAGLTWLKNHGFHVRGHVLVWPGWRHLPNAITALRGTPRQGEIPARALAHIADIVTATRDLVDEWDVLNEPYANHDLMDLFGPAIQADWFQAARAASPTVPLFLNDYSNHDASLDAGHVAHFETTARYLKDQGAPLGGLGLQAHISANPSPPANVLAVLDRYAALGLPVRITEFDVNTDDEQLQADYTRDFLIALYSHATVVGFQTWGFWENAHWIPKAAMYRADWSEKPNTRAYKSLVLDQWRTRANGTTDAQGTWHGRGFHGDYLVTVEINGQSFAQTFAVRPGASPTTVRVPLTTPRLTNLSTRANAGTGDATLIPGFVIDGVAPKQVLLRGVGAGLAPFGVTTTLGHMELTGRRGQSRLGHRTRRRLHRPRRCRHPHRRLCPRARQRRHRLARFTAARRLHRARHHARPHLRHHPRRSLRNGRRRTQSAPQPLDPRPRRPRRTGGDPRPRHHRVQHPHTPRPRHRPGAKRVWRQRHARQTVPRRRARPIARIRQYRMGNVRRPHRPRRRRDSCRRLRPQARPKRRRLARHAQRWRLHHPSRRHRWRRRCGARGDLRPEQLTHPARICSTCMQPKPAFAPEDTE